MDGTLGCHLRGPVPERARGRHVRAPANRPWQIAFGAPGDLPTLNHVILGMNANINFDLPQALVMVITDEEFDTSQS